MRHEPCKVPETGFLGIRPIVAALNRFIVPEEFDVSLQVIGLRCEPAFNLRSFCCT